jgi:hypothetical protein
MYRVWRVSYKSNSLKIHKLFKIKHKINEEPQKFKTKSKWIRHERLSQFDSKNVLNHIKPTERWNEIIGYSNNKTY